jgi:H+/Cl- antiporter ClcA
MMSHLPGFPVTVAVAVGMSAGVVTILRLPLTAVVIGTVLTAHSGDGVEPLIIVGVVVAYVATLLIDARWPADPATPAASPAAPAAPAAPAPAT